MPPDDPTPHAEFVAHDKIDPGGFEELPQPPERPGLRRFRVPLLIAGLVVVAAVVVLAIVVQGSSTRPIAAVSSPTPMPSASASRTVTLDPSSGRTVPNASPVTLRFLARLSPAAVAAARTNCPRLAPTCVTTGEAPSAVLRAVRSAFPHATHLIVLTDVAYQISSGRALAYRRISARSGRQRISVEIRAPVPSDGTRFGAADAAGGVSAFEQIRAGGLTVVVEVTAPLPAMPDERAIHRLAIDPRLLATG